MMVLAKYSQLGRENIPEFRLSARMPTLRSHRPGELGTRY